MIKVIAFDVFGTVFDLSGVNHEEIRDYAHHIRQETWSPLVLPESWKTLPAHADSKEGIDRLRRKFMVVTMSNGPLDLLAALSKHNNISWDAIIPIQMNKVYKPKPKAYLTICELMKVEPSEVMMVTANKTFGDIEAANSLGMQSQWIRGNSEVRDIFQLATKLGC
jgi:2-haloacid dehalogenase